MPALTVSWEDNALDLLEGRDRYTRNAIRQEFRRNPQKDAVELDPVQHTFLTPVSDRKFSVVWRLSADNAAVVRAVDGAGLTLASLEIQAPSLDDVFLAKTGRSLEGAAEAEAEAAEPAA